jgi:hypothetical protein
MKTTLGVIGYVIIWILFFGLLVNGCVHSCNKHKNDPVWLQETPAVIYRGVEYFWHDDFAGVNWTERIKDDVGTAVQLITASQQTYQINETKSEIEKFANKMKTYPVDKKLEIQDGVKKFILFSEYLGRDFYGYVVNFKRDSTFELANDTQRLYDSLDSYYNIGGINALKWVMDSVTNLIDDNNIAEYQDRVKTHNDYDFDIYAVAYQRLFNEKLERPKIKAL